jgi:hypothetical protein
MEGRGVYKFNLNTNTAVSGPSMAYYLGEFKDNSFHGLGRMMFRDGT